MIVLLVILIIICLLILTVSIKLRSSIGNTGDAIKMIKLVGGQHKVGISDLSLGLLTAALKIRDRDAFTGQLRFGPNQIIYNNSRRQAYLVDGTSLTVTDETNSSSAQQLIASDCNGFYHNHAAIKTNYVSGKLCLNASLMNDNGMLIPYRRPRINVSVDNILEITYNKNDKSALKKWEIACKSFRHLLTLYSGPMKNNKLVVPWLFMGPNPRSFSGDRVFHLEILEPHDILTRFMVRYNTVAINIPCDIDEKFMMYITDNYTNIIHDDKRRIAPFHYDIMLVKAYLLVNYSLTSKENIYELTEANIVHIITPIVNTVLIGPRGIDKAWHKKYIDCIVKSVLYWIRYGGNPSSAGSLIDPETLAHALFEDYDFPDYPYKTDIVLHYRPLDVFKNEVTTNIISQTLLALQEPKPDKPAIFKQFITELSDFIFNAYWSPFTPMLDHVDVYNTSGTIATHVLTTHSL